MRTRLHIQRKAPSKSSSAPVTNPFQSRPFAPPTAEEETLLQQKPTPDLQTQPERRQGSGYNFANVSVTPRNTPTPLILQRKLNIGEPGDKYEQEADNMARQVVSQINAPQSQPSGQAGTVQRDEMPPEKEEEQAIPVQAKLQSGTIQRDEMPPEKEEEQATPVQAKLESGTIQRDEMPPEKEEEQAIPVQAKLQSGTIQRDEMPPEKEEEQATPVQAKLESGTIQRDEMPPEKEEEQATPVQAKLQSGTIQRDEMPPEKEEEQATPVQAKLQSGTIQRDDVPKQEEEEQAAPVQAKSTVQRQSDGGGMSASPQLEESIQQARGSGQPLGDNIRKPMEQSFGADFSGVKVHTDSRSDQLNQSIQARAFTTGQDIFFRQGNYNPGSQDGQELLAHELTHVVQQSGGAIQQKPSESTY